MAFPVFLTIVKDRLAARQPQTISRFADKRLFNYPWVPLARVLSCAMSGSLDCRVRKTSREHKPLAKFPHLCQAMVTISYHT